MGALLKADMYRIFKNKLFLIAAILALVFPVFTVLLYFGLDKLFAASADIQAMIGLNINGLNMTGRELISEAFVLSSNMGLIVPIFATIFITQDVSNGTLRNKIIAGKSRSAIYFSHLISSGLIAGMLMLVNTVVFMLLSILFFGYGMPIDGGEMQKIVYFLATGVFTYFFSASISTAVTLTIKSTAPAIIISALAGMGISIITSLLHSLDTALTKTWFCVIPTYTNTVFLAAGGLSTKAFALGILSYVLFGGIISLAGFFLFKTHDVK